MKEIRHIIISDPHDCCGCTACASVCPRGSINMKENAEGFLYPSVDENTCIECGLCVKVCPVITQLPARRPLDVYAMKHPDQTVRDSSASGGAFPLLASAVIAMGGRVFGSRFDKEMEAVHDSASTPEEVRAFTGSKYLQSRMEDCYGRVRAALREGIPVLFTGTPCQVAGLNRFLNRGANPDAAGNGTGKSFLDKLVTADLICHGVPSPGVWRQYLAEEKEALRKQGYRDVKIEEVRFRDKEEGHAGWKGYRFKIFFSAKDPSGTPCRPVLSEAGKAENLFIRGFLADFYSRPSCYRCPAREFRSGSDLTIGDFWGIGDLRPEYDDDRGVSAILVNTEKGRNLLAALATPASSSAPSASSVLSASSVPSASSVLSASSAPSASSATSRQESNSSGSSESSGRSVLPDGADPTHHRDCADMLQMTLEDVLRRNRCLLTSVDETPGRAAFFQTFTALPDSNHTTQPDSDCPILPDSNCHIYRDSDSHIPPDSSRPSPAAYWVHDTIRSLLG